MKIHKMIPSLCTWQISMLTLITNILFVISTSPSPNPSHHDLLALLSLKSHITSDALSSWDAASNDTSKPVPNFCKWTGVTCGDRRHPGHVTAIDLHGYGLGGTISQDIGNLTYLHFIDLSSNNLVGDIPSSLGNCRRLRTMNLSSNHLSGSVPTPLGHLSKLKIFNVNNNNLTGEIPTTLFNVTTLMILRIGGNSFQGQIPSWLSNLTSLTDLYLVNNNFSGNIPADLCKLSNLTTFDVMNNKLDGPVPPSLFNISSITTLGLDMNQLTGSLPLDIGFKLPKLYALATYYNYFEGPIPASLSNASELQYLILRGNRYHGLIPRTLVFTIGHLKSLGTMDLSMNKLDGEIPEAIEGCVQLRFLYLQGNLLQEQIPKGLNTLGVLEKLDLSSNNLTGPIPKFLEGIRSLSYLNLSFNNLSGPVPDAGVFSNSTILSVTGNTMLCGGPPFLQLHSCPSIPSHKASPHRLHIFIFGAIGLFIFCVCSVTAYCFIKRRTTSTFVHHEHLFFNEEHERISYAELHKATGSFSPANLIGSGSSGKVYFGNLTFGENLATVAIKVLDLGQQRASRSFLAECNALKRIHHRKLVKVITVCSGFDHNGNEFKALVLEYICNGSLDDWLHPDKMTNSKIRRNLSLMKRLNIALDVAEALEYLHDHIDPRIVHCDIKPSNILLDDDLVGHVTDFGLAKIMSSEAGRKNHHETEGSSFAVKGTIGYIPPEYGSGCDVSTDGDTYSYGVLLLEMFTGRRPTDSFNDGVPNLVSFVKMAYPINLLEILDVTASYSRNTDTQAILDILVYPIFRVALACCNDSPRQRMKMHDIVEELNAIKMACAVQMPYS
ncbi:unnamed protein product [Miscanthus lutarioriparius]|uniref:Receptor kinase-like protein Xa21 n=1 Tax=Miscanthus lutarioriparius TaxID=422564 RepID=A0A811Q2H8_9POAL|nr:unnamed protein product [Miscanthus lutarioriparius]